MTDEDKKLIWEWCGIHFVNVLAYAAWVDRDGNQVVHPDFIPFDLNNLFKYVVPKLVENLWFIDIHISDETLVALKNYGKARQVAESMPEFDIDVPTILATDKDAVEAFGKALLILIKEKKWQMKIK